MENKTHPSGELSRYDEESQPTIRLVCVLNHILFIDLST